MDLRELIFFAFMLISLSVNCNAQAIFNATATVEGDSITVNIEYDNTTITTATFQCRLDSGIFVDCSDGFVYTSVAPGTHSITVNGVLDGITASPVTLTPLIVQLPLVLIASQVVQGTTVTLTISANQAATFECRLDDEPNFEPCTSGYQRSGLSAGQHTIAVRATSTVTPTLQTEQTLTFTVLMNAITIDEIAANQNFEEDTITFEFDISENFPTQCSFDDRTFMSCASPYTVDASTLTTGENRITIRTVIDGVVRGIAEQQFDVLEPVTIELKDTTYSVLENATVFNVTVVKQGNPGRDITVRIVTTDNTTDELDRVEQIVPVTFRPGDPDEKIVQLTVRDDEFLERDETFFIDLELVSTNTGGQLGARTSAGGTVINDDSREVNFVLQPGDNLVEESDDITIFRFQLDGETRVDFDVIAETFDLVPSDAEVGEDYQANNRTVTFNRDDTESFLTVTIVDDDITERTESFGIRLILPEETQQLGVNLGDDSEAIIGIEDNDEGDLEITCYTVYSSENRTVTLFFEGNQETDFSCAINDGTLDACTSPTTFQNVDFSDSVTVTVRGETTLRTMPQTVTRTKDVLVIEAGLQVIGTDSISVPIRSTKNATYMCRLNDMDPVECVDGQVFNNLAGGTYTVFVEATGVDNIQEIADDSVGPIVIGGAGASAADAIAACFGRQDLGCDTNGLNCEYSATWRTRGDRVTFRLQIALQGWAAIGFSRDDLMPNTDIIAGAADGTNSFVDDRYAQLTRQQPPQDSIQNVDDASASFEDGNTIIEFSRDKITNDPVNDTTLDVCRFVLSAWGDGVNVAAQEIRFHGNRRDSSDTLICFPSNILCPEKFDCADPGTPVNGGRNFTDGTLEDSVVTYTCDTGFTLVGPTMQTCVLEADGPVWRNESLPTCTMNVCPDPGQPDNGNTIGDDFSIGATVNHTCNVGYVLDGASKRECLPSGNWSDPLPVCNEIDCGDPGTPTNGNTMGTLIPTGPSDDLALDTSLGAVINHTCNVGFVLQGAMERVCLPNGDWSQPLPTCIVDCGDPGTPPNGSTSVSDTTVEAVANHTCDGGFVPRGTTQRECLPNGEWSGSLPMCVVDCGDPGTPVNGNTEGTLVGPPDALTLDTSLGAVVNHSCIEGYTLQGAVKRECLPNGSWSLPLPTCIIIICEDPGEPDNGATSGTAVTVGSIVNHTCDVGFILNGANQRECLPNGMWSSPLPTCTRNITRFGGPVFKVPIHIDQTLIDENPDLAEACLCYEVQGVDNKTFNLLSDTCVSVNALYQAMANPTDGNVISRIGITAIDQDGTCRRIEASLDGCSASVDGTPVVIGSPFSDSGISVISYENRVRISVPNCGIGKHELVIWFICKTLENGQPVSEFVIARGVNLRPTSHGLIGQFWNIPVGVNDYELGDPQSVPYYVIDVNPFNSASRTFISLLNDLPKHVSPIYCLQVGDSQGGATDRSTDPNDSVIEGTYTDYEVSDLFSTDFTFSTFGSVCAK